MTASDFRIGLGRRIARLRQERGMNQTQLAHEANVHSRGRTALTQNMVSRIEKGQRDVTLIEGIALADALRVHWHELGRTSDPRALTRAGDAAAAYMRAEQTVDDKRDELAEAQEQAREWRERAAERWQELVEAGETDLIEPARVIYRSAGLGYIVDEKGDE